MAISAVSDGSRHIEGVEAVEETLARCHLIVGPLDHISDFALVQSEGLTRGFFRPVADTRVRHGVTKRADHLGKHGDDETAIFASNAAKLLDGKLPVRDV